MAGDDKIQDSARVRHQGRIPGIQHCSQRTFWSTQGPHIGPTDQGPPIRAHIKEHRPITRNRPRAGAPPCSFSQARALAAVVASTPIAPLSQQSHQQRHLKSGGRSCRQGPAGR